MANIIIVQDNTDRINAIIGPKGSKNGLYLGSQSAASDLQLLKGLNITCVLTVAGQLFNKYPTQYSHLKINIQDQPLAYIYQYFEQTYEYIKKQLEKGNVLVHCKMGISRSACIVISYIMRKYKYSYEKAYLKVKAKRPKINPNEGFRMQLKQYQKKLDEHNSKLKK